MTRIDVRAEVTGKVWKVEMPVGGQASPGDTLLVIESMKMEIPVTCDSAGTVTQVLVAEGDSVEEGQVVAVLEG